jgi:hypothetical protein
MREELEKAIAMYYYLGPDCGGCEDCVRKFTHVRKEFDELVKTLTEEEKDILFGEG